MSAQVKPVAFYFRSPKSWLSPSHCLLWNRHISMAYLTCAAASACFQWSCSWFPWCYTVCFLVWCHLNVPIPVHSFVPGFCSVLCSVPSVFLCSLISWNMHRGTFSLCSLLWTTWQAHCFTSLVCSWLCWPVCPENSSIWLIYGANVLCGWRVQASNPGYSGDKQAP